jgi:hypothetical protein
MTVAQIGPCDRGAGRELGKHFSCSREGASRIVRWFLDRRSPGKEARGAERAELSGSARSADPRVGRRPPRPPRPMAIPEGRSDSGSPGRDLVSCESGTLSGSPRTAAPLFDRQSVGRSSRSPTARRAKPDSAQPGQNPRVGRRPPRTHRQMAQHPVRADGGCAW